MDPAAAPDHGVTQVLRRPDVLRHVSVPSAVPSAAPQSWRELAVFRGLPADVLERLVAALVPVSLREGDVLMQQDAPGDALFVLDEGVLGIHIAVPGQSQGLETPPLGRQLPAPAIVGEMALITRDPRSATVTALRDCRVLRMDRPVFEELCRVHPQTSVFLTCLVGDRLMENHGIRKVGKYEVIGRLGSGGVATVFEAIHPGLGISVALKMLSHTLVLDPSYAEHFGREGRIVAQLAHDHIVRVLDTERAYGTQFIVMEKLSGELLEHIIARRQRLPWSEVRRYLAETAEALHYSHGRGLVHRDIKPANIFVTDERKVKLLDFGIAVQQGAAIDEDGRIVGTPHYMSPEQILGNDLDGRADLYALGIVAYELCVHQVPFTAPTVQEVFTQHLTQPLPDPRQFCGEIPDDLAAFIVQATAKKRADRFASCAEAAAFLRRPQRPDAVAPAQLAMLAVAYPHEHGEAVAAILRTASEQLQRLPAVTSMLSQRT
jgi:CRP-like cAMP-binding protein